MCSRPPPEIFQLLYLVAGQCGCNLWFALAIQTWFSPSYDFVLAVYRLTNQDQCPDNSRIQSSRCKSQKWPPRNPTNLTDGPVPGSPSDLSWWSCDTLVGWSGICGWLLVLNHWGFLGLGYFNCLGLSPTPQEGSDVTQILCQKLTCGSCT